MTPTEQTSGKREAQQALAESRRAEHRTDSIIDEARAALATVKADRLQNHYADKFRIIIRGNRAG